MPISNGQRACIVSAPKAGKSTALLQMAKTAKLFNSNLTVFALLVDQAPELIGQYRKIMPTENLVYTTYEDVADRQVFLADSLLKRAKRYAECGNIMRNAIKNYVDDVKNGKFPEENNCF